MNKSRRRSLTYDESDELLTEVNRDIFGDEKKKKRRPAASVGEKKRATFRKATTNVVAIKLGSLTDDVVVATGDPLLCTKCGAAFSKNDLQKEEPKVNQDDDMEEIEEKEQEEIAEPIWKCTFCDTENELNLEEEEYPTDTSVDYILAPPETKSDGDLEDEKSFIFCIDISGSMCVTTELKGKHSLKGDATSGAKGIDTQGVDQYRALGADKNVTYVSRLQSVQAAVDSQLQEMQNNHPNRKVGIITFNNDVSVIGDGKSTACVISGDKLTNFDALVAQGKELQKKYMSASIKDSRKDLGKKLFDLQETGPTALGPALVTAVALASGKRGSEVVICTDGLANIGIGSMDDLKTEKEEEAVEGFYRRVGLYAKEAGVAVSVISIEGTDCSVENLGIVADVSGGEVTIVDPLKITTQFKEILALPVIATNVSVKFLLHHHMYVHDYDDEDGDDEASKQEKKKASSFVKDVGNVTSESEFTVEYSVRDNLTKEQLSGISKLPFQLQIRYVKLNGMKCIRVISQEQAITWDDDEAEKDVDVEVLGLNAVQTTAKIARQGDYTAARFQNFTYMNLMNRTATNDAQKAQAFTYLNQANELEDVLQDTQLEERDEGIQFSTAPSVGDRQERNKTRKKRRAKKDKTANTFYKYTQLRKKNS